MTLRPLQTPDLGNQDLDQKELLVLVEDLAEEMAQRWEAGECPLTEEFLERHPELYASPQAALELISEEIYLRQQSNQEATAAEYVGRFPQWQKQVQTLLECHQVLGPQLAAPRFPLPGESLDEFHLLAELG